MFGLRILAGRVCGGIEVSEFREAQKTERVKGVPSWYDKLAPQLDDQQRSDLDDALADRGIYPTVISTVLSRWGHEVTPGQISWHRKRHGL